MNIEEPNSDKLKYLERYDPLNDYITSSANKKQKSDFKIDESLIDIKMIHSYMGSLSKVNNFEDNIVLLETLVEQLQCGFNGLVYGYGSKEEFLTEVATEFMKSNMQQPQVLVFQVKGYRPQFNIRQMLTHLRDALQQLFKVTQKPDSELGKREDQLISQIRALLESSQNEISLLLLIHSIDGKKLLQRQVQQYIGDLSGIYGVRVLGSFENYKYPQISAVQNVLYLNHDTFSPYINEIQQIFEGSLNKQKDEEGLWFVLKSMTSRQKEIVMYLSQALLDQQEKEDLFALCLEEMVVSSKEQLKENLRELQEHNIIVLKKEKYTMNYGAPTIKKLSEGRFEEQ